MTKCEQNKKHQHPVHFNRRPGHVWVCMECEKQIYGPKLKQDELVALISVFKSLTKEEK